MRPGSTNLLVSTQLRHQHDKKINPSSGLPIVAARNAEARMIAENRTIVISIPFLDRMLGQP
jgi:hypothetical protein